MERAKKVREYIKMPKAFEEAVRKGAKVHTKKLPGGKYIHIAILGTGKSVGGKVHKKKGNPMPEKEKEKEKSRMAAKRRLMEYQKSLRQPKKKTVKKAKPQSRFSELIAGLRKKVGKLRGWKTERTKDVKRQLKLASIKFKTDAEKEAEKKRREK